MSFSERIGLTPERQIQVESMDDRLRNRLYNFFFEINEDGSVYKYDLISYTLDKMGKRIKDGWESKEIEKIFLEDSIWFVPYECIEYAMRYIYDNQFYILDDCLYDYGVEKINTILIEEKSGYRFVNGQFVPITDETELEEIKTAMHSEFDAVDTHISKALSLYSDRDNPDYENSIKESISAVESMCCIITGMTGGSATLGSTLKKLEDNGVVIHEAMKSAFRQLYGYTSDEDGIRHGGIDFKNAPEEDARYMLVSCSAFVNYLKDKYVKSKKAE